MDLLLDSLGECEIPGGLQTKAQWSLVLGLWKLVWKLTFKGWLVWDRNAASISWDKLNLISLSHFLHLALCLWNCLQEMIFWRVGPCSLLSDWCILTCHISSLPREKYQGKHSKLIRDNLKQRPGTNSSAEFSDYYGLNCVPSNLHIAVWIPSTSECNHIRS